MSATFFGRLKSSVERGGPIKYPQKPVTEPTSPQQKLAVNNAEIDEEDTSMFNLTKPPEQEDAQTRIEKQRRDDEE